MPVGADESRVPLNSDTLSCKQGIRAIYHRSQDSAQTKGMLEAHTVFCFGKGILGQTTPYLVVRTEEDDMELIQPVT